MTERIECEVYVHLIDGSCITVTAMLWDDDEAVLRAGGMVGQDIAHLVKEVEWGDPA